MHTKPFIQSLHVRLCHFESALFPNVFAAAVLLFAKSISLGSHHLLGGTTSPRPELYHALCQGVPVWKINLHHDVLLPKTRAIAIFTANANAAQCPLA